MKASLLLLVLASGALFAACARPAPTPASTPTLVSAPAPTGNPAWVDRLIADATGNPGGSPQAIYRYHYRGKTVYYVLSPCCDMYNYLYDADGNAICAPDGGFTGRGDGKCPDFKQTATDRIVIWERAQ